MAELPKYKMYVDGKWVEAASGEYFESFNPFTGKPFEDVKVFAFGQPNPARETLRVLGDHDARVDALRDVALRGVLARATRDRRGSGAAARRCRHGYWTATWWSLRHRIRRTRHTRCRGGARGD